MATPGRKPGTPKTGGRKSGIPNLSTQELHAKLKNLNIDVIDSIVSELPGLDPEARVNVYLKLMEYLYPKRKAIEHSGPDGEPISVVSLDNCAPEDIEALKRIVKRKLHE
jgi:hypothetical protein